MALLGGACLALLVGSVVRLAQGGPRREPAMRLLTWWALYAVFLAAVLLGPGGLLLLLLAAAVLGLREFALLVGWRPPAGVPALWPWLAALAAAPYLWLLVDWRSYLAAALPLWGVLAAAVLATAWRQGRPRRAATSLAWGLWLAALGPSFVLLPLRRPGPSDALLWPVLLVLLTVLNDIFQAQVGRRWGRRPIAPAVSPRKTWEGWLGGLAVTVLVAGVTAVFEPALRQGPGGTDRLLWALAAGALVSAAGLLGDLGESLVKREVGARDSGELLPGQGGLLDRIDSLGLTAPVFFLYGSLVWWQ